jgi:hypothetical protein
MPKWWNEQQVCGTYTQEAQTVGARMVEKGAHVGHARQRGARTRGAYGNGGVYVGRVRQRGRVRGARAATGGRARGVSMAKGLVRARP